LWHKQEANQMPIHKGIIEYVMIYPYYGILTSYKKKLANNSLGDVLNILLLLQMAREGHHKIPF
jgi:hypothetical protein